MAVVASQVGLRLIDDEDIVGINVVPIAALFAGDFLCFDFRLNSIEPAVSVWNHETSDEFSPDLTEISSSFIEFLDLLSAISPVTDVL